MLLVLALVYLFHGFQSYASPLTGLITDSSSNAGFQSYASPLTSLITDLSSNATVLSIPACVCPANQRSIWDILWSCLATLFACSWVSVHPNIPFPDESRWRIFLRRLELMFWAVVGPEMINAWAFRQWKGARKLEKLYKDRDPRYRWTKTHGHFLQMGGFMLFEGNIADGVLSPERFSKLLEAELIEFPTVTVEEIEDRSKADAFSKSIALGQTLWFITQCIVRKSQHMDLTFIELLTCSLAVLNGVMYVLWWNKPLDVRFPIRVDLLDRSNESEDSEPNEPNGSNESNTSDEPGLDRFVYSLVHEIITLVFEDYPDVRQIVIIIWQSPRTRPPVLSRAMAIILVTLVLIPFIISYIILFPLVLSFYIPTIYLFFRWFALFGANNEFNIGDMKVPTFYSTWGDINSVTYILFVTVVGVIFGLVHCAGWFFSFPSNEEAILWRVSSVILTSIAVLSPLLLTFLDRFIKTSIHINARMFAFFLFSIIILAYIVSRLLLLVEAFVSLRHLTPGMLALVKWTTFIPHI